MLRSFSGPWKQVFKFKADSIGHEDMEQLSESQDFKGFYETSRVRMVTMMIMMTIMMMMMTMMM